MDRIQHGTAEVPPERNVWNRTAAFLLILAGIPAFGGLALLGLPGALLLTLASPVAALLSDQRVPGDGAWALAIIQTVLWPWVLVPAYLLAVWISPPGRWRVLATTAYSLMGGVIVAVIVQLVMGRI